MLLSIVHNMLNVVSAVNEHGNVVGDRPLK